MANPHLSGYLQQADVVSELTKLLRHGYGVLVIKIHGNRIAALETTIRQTRINRGGEKVL